MKKKSQSNSILASNPKARFDYQITKKTIAGVQLLGCEVKALRLKSASLKGSYAKIIGDEIFLINAQINPYKFAVAKDYDPKRSRKLLLKKKEIAKLKELSNAKNWTIVPLSILLRGNLIKVELGVGKGKKEFEKREIVKRRDIKRRLASDYKIGKIKI